MRMARRVTAGSDRTAVGSIDPLLPIAHDAFQFYSKLEYIADMTKRARAAKPGDRIVMMTLVLDPVDPPIGRLFDSLCKAAERGVKVMFMVDAYNLLLTGRNGIIKPGPLFYHREIPAETLAGHPMLQALKRLEAAGGRGLITNRPGRRFTNPFAGRSHIKLGLVNDRIYVGGCNLMVSSEIDMMVGWNDPEAAAWLHDICDQIAVTGNTDDAFQDQDIVRPLDARTELLIDAGKPQQSIIYHKALQLIDEAKESVFITCQYFPNHVTARHLAAAHKRGAQVTIIYNHPDKDNWPFNLIHRAVVRLERRRNPGSFFVHELPAGTSFLHAKVLATESAGMVGSHNYVRAGVNWGTAEIALLRHDAEFGRHLRDKIEALIAAQQ